MFDEHNLPVKIVYSHIGEFSIEGNLYNITSQEVKIKLEDVYLIASPKGQIDWSIDT